MKRSAFVVAQAMAVPVFALVLIVLWPPIIVITEWRRRSDRVPRVIFTPTASINNLGYARAMRRSGYIAMTSVYAADSMVPGESYDVFLDLRRFASPIRFVLPFAAFIWALARFDVVFCYFNVSGFLGPTALRYAELPLYKLFGKKIIAAPYGADVQRWSLLPAALQPYYPKEQEAAVLRNVRHTAKYADFKISGGDLVPHMPHDICLSLVAVDLDEMRPHYPSDDNSGPCRIIHATGHPQLKGTHYIESACKKLKAEGQNIEYLFVSGLDNARARGVYASADVIVDQLLLGTYGMFAVEGMALGKPVVSFISPEVKAANPSFASLPIVVADTENIAEKLRLLAGNAPLRRQCGQASRRYAEKFHGLEFMADLFDGIIRHVWFGAPAPRVTADGLSGAVPQSVRADGRPSVANSGCN